MNKRDDSCRFWKKHSSIRDVLYGYIPFTAPVDGKETAEKHIIDSIWVQRMRRIFQLQTAWLVFPSATHTRFQHLFGTMYLSGIFARHLYDSFKCSFPNEYIPDKNHVEETFRLAGLLHDIGHGPLGHAFDDVYYIKKLGITHEDMAVYIIKNYLAPLIRKIRRSPNGVFPGAIDVDYICSLIKISNEKRPGGPLWQKYFAGIMTGIISVDLLDYLMRDSYFCKIQEYGQIDYQRLISNTFLTRRGLTINKKSLPALKGFLRARLDMSRNVYGYSRNQIYNFELGSIVGEAIELSDIGDLRDSIDEFLKLDDFSMYTGIADSIKDPDRKREIKRRWHRTFIERNSDYDVVYEAQLPLGPDTGTNRLGSIRSIVRGGDSFRKYVLGGIKHSSSYHVKLSLMDVRPADLAGGASRKKLNVYDEASGKFCTPDEIEIFFNDIPVKYFQVQIFGEKKALNRADSLRISRSSDKMLGFKQKAAAGGKLRKFLDSQYEETNV